MAKKASKKRKPKIDAEVSIESGNAGTLQIQGVPADLADSPARIHALLDALHLPKGTRVTLTVRASSSIVR